MSDKKIKFTNDIPLNEDSLSFAVEYAINEGIAERQGDSYNITLYMTEKNMEEFDSLMKEKAASYTPNFVSENITKEENEAGVFTKFKSYTGVNLRAELINKDTNETTNEDNIEDKEDDYY